MPLPTAIRKALAFASNEAHAYGHGVIRPEHLLLGFLQDESVTTLLERIRIDPQEIAQSLDQYLATLPQDRPYKAKQALPKDFSAEALAIMSNAAPHMDEVTPLRALIAMVVTDKSSFAAEALREHGVTQKEIKLAITPVRLGGKFLKLYCTNLNQEVVSKNIQPPIGRDAELGRIIKTLSRKNKANPILIGDSGVGKTAAARGLAYQIVHHRMPANLQDAQVFALNIPTLVAGANYQGEVENRMKNILKEIAADKNAILLIDDLHTLPADALDVLKPALDNGEIRCVATSNHKHYRTNIESNHALSRQLLKIELAEPGIVDTLKIVKKSILPYEEYHGVRYRPDAIIAAVRLANRYLHDKKMPDKAFDVLDQAGANKNYNGGGKTRTIKATDVERVVSEMTGIPATALSRGEQEKIKSLEADLKKAVMDQDNAARILAAAIRRSRAGLNDPSKPIGSFLFQGPTGVGKTEITKQLGATLGMKVLRFDMSEYMEKHSVARLIGAPPGYVGYDQGGLLTGAAEKSPHSIILLDEIEKAHPDIYNILLQIMDYGKLTDNNGKQIDFRNAIIVMTTNAGSSESSISSAGFGAAFANDNDSVSGQNEEAIKRTFSPEFRNRLDAIVPFRHLERGTVLKIADKFLSQLAERLKERKIDFQWTEEARNWLGDQGYNREFGARPMARLIQEAVANPLADEILDGRLKSGGNVRLSFNQAAQGGLPSSKLQFVYEDVNPNAKRRPGGPDAKIA